MDRDRISQIEVFDLQTTDELASMSLGHVEVFPVQYSIAFCLNQRIQSN